MGGRKAEGQHDAPCDVSAMPDRVHYRLSADEQHAADDAAFRHDGQVSESVSGRRHHGRFVVLVGRLVRSGDRVPGGRPPAGSRHDGEGRPAGVAHRSADHSGGVGAGTHAALGGHDFAADQESTRNGTEISVAQPVAAVAVS